MAVFLTGLTLKKYKSSKATENVSPSQQSMVRNERQIQQYDMHPSALITLGLHDHQVGLNICKWYWLKSS